MKLIHFFIVKKAYYLKRAVLQIRDVYPGSRILIFTHPGSRISDPGSRIPDLGSRISDPGSRIPDLRSRISDLGSQIPDSKTAKKEWGEKLVVRPFFVATYFAKLIIILFLKC
jgi:hypothetical protein